MADPIQLSGASMLRCLLAVVFVALTLGVSRSQSDDGQPRKVALLVGVNKYLKPGFRPLQFAEADVNAVAGELRQLGFDVTVLLGSAQGAARATRDNIDAAARRLVAPLGQQDIALVMLSGHGQTLKRPGRTEDLDESFFCPVDAIINDPASQYSLSQLLDEILAPNVGRKLLLVDACRDVPTDVTRGARNTKGIEGRIVALPEDTAVFFSCRAGQLSFERAELGHGLFTWCVLEGLRGEAADDGEISWAGLVAHVGKRMNQPDLTRYMPRSLPQIPIPAGALPYTVLGKITPVSSSPSTPAAARLAVRRSDTDRDHLLKEELKELETALFVSSDEAWRIFTSRASRRLTAWQEAADEGSHVAQFFMGRCHQKGISLSRDAATARELFEQAAEGGVGLAWNSLGAIAQGEGELSRAAECFRRGGDLGCAAAMYNLGTLYERGNGVPRSEVKAFEWYLRAAEAGEPSGMFKVGRFYAEGLGSTPNGSLAVHWLERGVAHGNGKAMAYLGNAYYGGKHGLPQNYAKAHQLFELGATRGDGYCMRHLGNMYYQGHGVTKNKTTALQWWRRAWNELPSNPDSVDRERQRKLLLYNFGLMNASP